jgi:hypothetical protein
MYTKKMYLPVVGILMIISMALAVSAVVDTNLPWHPANQVSVNTTTTTSIDKYYVKKDGDTMSAPLIINGGGFYSDGALNLGHISLNSNPAGWLVLGDENNNVAAARGFYSPAIDANTLGSGGNIVVSGTIDNVDVSALGATVSVQTTQIATHTTQIATNAADLATTQAALATAQADLATTQANLAAANAKLNKIINNNCPSGKYVSGFQTDGTLICCVVTEGNTCTSGLCINGQIQCDGTCGGTCCTAESNALFCSNNGATCGTVTALDNCGTPRTVNCGSCGTNSCSAALHLTGTCSQTCSSGTCVPCTPSCSCASGYYNCDGNMGNGCESSSSCNPCSGKADHTACTGGECLSQVCNECAWDCSWSVVNSGWIYGFTYYPSYDQWTFLAFKGTTIKNFATKAAYDSALSDAFTGSGYLAPDGYTYRVGDSSDAGGSGGMWPWGFSCYEPCRH